jgi:Uma2 family endonuclease
MTNQELYVDPMTPQAPVRAEELLSLAIPDKRVELVRGIVVVREPPGYAHGRVAAELATALSVFAKRTGLGYVTVETGYKLESDPDTVRGPDVAFIRAERAPAGTSAGFPPLAPDLAVEIASPTNRPGETLERVADLLRAGARLVWVVDPRRQAAQVYRPDGTVSHVAAGELLTGEDVLPGFTVPLSSVLQ